MANVALAHNSVLEDGPETQPESHSSWKILIVDDEEQVHRVTVMALSDVTFDGRPLEFLGAYSEKEAREIVEGDADIALILLDVVMETDDAGLRLVEYIREQQGNKDVRIIIRTGQAGVAPERAVVTKYDINGFYEKTELTVDKLFSTVYTGLSSYRDVHALREEVKRRRQVEKLQIQQTSKLENANNRLRQFASLAAHDMKEPLRKMIIFGERLEAQLGEQMSPEISAYVNKVKKDAARLSTLINDLQAMSDLNTDKPERERLDLNEVMQAVLEENADHIRQTGAKVDYDNLPTVVADRTCMELLFQNLISNAIKYARQEEPLRLKFTATQVGDSKNNVTKIWEIRAQDNGIGIEPEYQAKIFETFFRLHGKEISGSGVGLALCKQLLELHDGDIRVESTPGEGSTFIITLPADRAA